MLSEGDKKTVSPVPLHIATQGDVGALTFHTGGYETAYMK